MRATRATATATIIPLTAFALLLAGCSGAPGESSGGGLSHDDSPLAVYLEAAWGSGMSQEERDKEMADTNRRIEDLVAACMKDEGFDYVPVVYDPSDDAGVEFEWEPEKREWVEEYGYGIMNDPFLAANGGELEEYTDANTAYVDSLSESERAAYMEALYGPMIEDEDEAAMSDYDWTTAGCYGEAQHETSGDEAAYEEQFTDLFEKINELWEKQQKAPETAALDAEWAQCMDAAGAPGFTKQSDALDSISKATVDLQSEYAASADGDSSGDAAVSKDAALSEDAAVTTPDLSETPDGKKLAERELALALIDLDCREQTDYVQESLRIQFAIEERFIAENKAELEAFKAAAEQAG